MNQLYKIILNRFKGCYSRRCKGKRKRIRELREANPDATQTEIGEYVGLSRQAVNKYEKRLKKRIGINKSKCLIIMDNENIY